MSTVLLIHGAWHGGWCWERVAPRLEAAGHRVVAPDLPGHAGDTTPAKEVTLASFSRAVRDAARSAGEPVVAVGHSMGGFAITLAAQDEPGLFASLVYLCAFVPQDGESLIALAGSDTASLVPEAAAWGEDDVRIKPERARDLFYGDCSEAEAQWATDRLCPAPAAPLFEILTRRADLGVPQTYLECLKDRAISLDTQRRMAGRFHFDRILSLDTSHSPFLSAPDATASLLDAVARGVA